MLINVLCCGWGTTVTGKCKDSVNRCKIRRHSYVKAAPEVNPGKTPRRR